jgi:hypothetical protein
MTDGISGLIFQELTFHATAVLRGKVARLPVIFAMRGMEDTLSPLNRINPLFWCLEDADGFFRHYIAYRNKLVRRIRGETLATKSDRCRFGLWRRALRRSLAAMSRRSHDGIPALQRAVPDHGELQQTIDLIHTIWLQHEFDRGILNHAVRQRLGDALPPIDPPREWPGWRELAEGDAVHSSALAARRYIWRKDVLSAEPRDEIKIDTNEIAQVERELEAYRLD